MGSIETIGSTEFATGKALLRIDAITGADTAQMSSFAMVRQLRTYQQLVILTQFQRLLRSTT